MSSDLGVAGTLRELRLRQQMTGTELARKLGWPQSKVSKVENGRQMPSEEDTATWASVCEAPTELVENLLTTLEGERAGHRSTRQRMDRGRVAVQRDYARLEQAGGLIRYCEMNLIPGLLQTEEYAESILQRAAQLNGTSESESIGDAVRERMARQPVLYASDKEFHFIIGEEALRRRPCAPEVMATQLDRLLSVVGLRRVRLGILPDSGYLPGPVSGGFAIFDNLAIAETLTSEIVYRGDAATPFATVFESLAEHALYGDAARWAIMAARDLLTSPAASLDRTHRPVHPVRHPGGSRRNRVEIRG